MNIGFYSLSKVFQDVKIFKHWKIISLDNNTNWNDNLWIMYVCGIVHCHDPNDASWINYTKNQTENDISNDEKYTSFFSWNSFIRLSVQITWRRRLHHNLVSHLRWHWLMGIITEYAWFGTNIEVKIFNIHMNFLFDSDSLISELIFNST